MTYDYELRKQEASFVRVRHDTLCDECLSDWTRDGWKAEPLRQVDSHRRACRLCGACDLPGKPGA